MPLQTTDLATSLTTTARLIGAKPSMSPTRLEEHLLASYDEAIAHGDDVAADLLGDLADEAAAGRVFATEAATTLRTIAVNA